MKDQTSPLTTEAINEAAATTIEDVTTTPSAAPTKLLSEDATSANIESDEDSGYLNASDNSLSADDVATCETSIKSRSSEEETKQQQQHNDKQPSDDSSGSNSNDEENSAVSSSSWRLDVPSKVETMSDDKLVEMLKSLGEEFEKLPEQVDRRKWAKSRVAELFGETLTQPLLDVAAGHLIDGDSGISMDQRPDWLDPDKFRRGQIFARDFQFGISYAELISLFMVFSFEEGLKPLIMTSQSGTPFTAFKRYLSTGCRVQSWYTSDPWTKGTQAYRDMKAVRMMHAAVRKRIEATTIPEYEAKTRIDDAWCPTLNVIRRDFQSTCPAPAPGQCPYMIVSKYPELRGKKLSQGEMASTQFAFVGLVVLNPKFFGIHASDEDLEAFCHTWRGIGYLLGIEDEFNYCRGTLADVKQRTMDFIEYWVKPNFRQITPECEHMMRCVVEGLQYYFPGSTYETCILDLASVLNLHMPRLYNSLSYQAWIRHNVIRMYFNFWSRFSGMRTMMNNQLNRSIEKARKFDDEKLNSLKIKSDKLLESYRNKLQQNREANDIDQIQVE
ncbi:uncharacterized protein LOC106650904 [Trichogramma pretiosum]|uniref:uncharacterized protein LOC106650904 n=1 Tax=Trichogramma pretiosum TaxID=7493 RepID=UPI0006C9D019|nr:uncharacterized protein LOC106650904 [Trichogramma pretiosum]XP_014224648.1 uncharacterized protein LOC106650904 [Trichogramma pretiosum]XP_014224649.1 uncharacterized protein LOC106650904 [Trichogramma pretiosum]XP_014224650.1 uncharacterized protein LOC106650904 [Trichogramma pretiosum]